MSTKVAAIIPARYESSRFPGKPLADILGKSMIRRVVESVGEARNIDDIYVATDDERIMKEVDKTVAEPVMTPETINSGSDRVAHVAADLEADIIVNVQGDEPLIEGASLDRGIEKMISGSAEMASYMAKRPMNELDNPDFVTVVVDNNNRALYFSRRNLPHTTMEQAELNQHIGIYIFRRPYLLKYSNRAPTPLEKIEDLEQLRALEHGDTITMVELDEPTVGVDRPADVETVEQILRRRDSSD